jgi:RimJ/RimL family protein N-acetyltransferase
MGKEDYRAPSVDSRIEILRPPSLRVSLYQFIPDDAQEIFNLIDASRLHLSQPGVDTTKHPAVQSVLDSITNPSNPKRLKFAIRDKQNRLVGSISLTPDEDDSSLAEIDYYLGVQYTGQGYMTEAAFLLTCYAFIELGYMTVHADVYPDNIKATEVLKRLEWVETDRKEDGHVVYSLTKSMETEEDFIKRSQAAAQEIAEAREKYGDNAFFWFNNFREDLPGGSRRTTIESDYPGLDRKMFLTDTKSSDLKRSQTLREFWATIDRVIEELGINLQELIDARKKWSGLPDDKKNYGPHLDLMIPIYLRLLEIGYNDHDLWA